MDNLDSRESYSDLNVFGFGERWFTLGEMLAWAEYTGHISECLEHLQHTEEAVQNSFDMDQDRLQSEVNDFRYRQNLITTAETQNWLKERSLHLDDLYTYVYRKLANPRKHLMLTLSAWKKRCEDPARDVWGELHFGGLFQPLVDDFICRVAVADEKGLLDETPTVEMSGTDASDRDHVFFTSEFRYVEAWEHAYNEYCAEVADRDSCERRLRAHRHELLKVKFEALSFKNLEAAKEAYCCIRYDGEAVESLAGRTKVPFEREYGFIEDLPEILQQKLFSAHAQECLEPIRTSPQRGYTVYVMLRKTEPHLNNSEVRNRLQRKIVREKLERDIQAKLQWTPWKQGEAV